MLKPEKLITFLTSISLSIAAVFLSLAMFMYALPNYKANEVIATVQHKMTKEMECLAKNIYYEAASESFEGKLAVAQVTINRTNSRKYPSGICEVVYQRNAYNGQTVCQFSWTCMKVDAPRNRYLWEEAQYIARKALTEPVAHAKIAEKKVMFYHANYVQPGWNKKYAVMTIGNHIFYTRL